VKIGKLKLETVRKVAGLFEHRPDKHDSNTMLDIDALEELESIVGELERVSPGWCSRSGVAIAWNRVVELGLYHHELFSFPDCIVKMKSLTFLDLQMNQLTSMPETIGQLKSLKSLNINNNKLVAIPDSIGQLTALTDLDLSNNKLESLPESIGNLTALKHLNLENNNFAIMLLPEPVRDAIKRLIKQDCSIGYPVARIQMVYKYGQN
jgi:Leucine-rich repeat (LRR) protein